MADDLSFSPEGSPADAIKRRRGEILGWLRDDAEPLAAIFETVTQLIDRLPFPAATRFNLSRRSRDRKSPVGVRGGQCRFLSYGISTACWPDP